MQPKLSEAQKARLLRKAVLAQDKVAALVEAMKVFNVPVSMNGQTAMREIETLTKRIEQS